MQDASSCSERASRNLRRALPPPFGGGRPVGQAHALICRGDVTHSPVDAFAGDASGARRLGCGWACSLGDETPGRAAAVWARGLRASMPDAATREHAATAGHPDERRCGPAREDRCRRHDGRWLRLVRGRERRRWQLRLRRPRWASQGSAPDRVLGARPRRRGLRREQQQHVLGIALCHAPLLLKACGAAGGACSCAHAAS
mmetsp:Transcript_11377/g.47581  ORF Transcript_11377/g.47581 Transcript_11377/m.47581 type:complete len:201 (+) Transcript_11377:1509-2111(+)